ncbi:MAG: hypothetical protein Q7R92_01020 [bacterium]|nr:hypothetical protein [bacterium]
MIFSLYQIYDVLKKLFNIEWSFLLTLLNLILIGYTVSENIKLRKETQRQNKLSKQPYLGFRINPLHWYVIFNESPNMAFNIFIILKNGECYKILNDGYIIGAMPVGKEKEINPDSLVNINRDGLTKKIESVKCLVEYLERKKQDYQCIIYEDVFGNKLFSVFYVSSISLEYDRFSEIKYFNEIY